MFDFDMESEPTIVDDILLINGKVPKEKMGASIILITCDKREEGSLKEFIRNEDGTVFVFADEPSMDHFRRLIQGSKYYLNEGFNFVDLQYIGQSKVNRVKFLKYILAEIIPQFENQSDIFGNSNEETQELLEYYEDERFDDDKISGIFCYIMYGGFGDHFDAEDLIDNAMNDIYK